MKAKELKNKGIKVELQGKDYEIKFNMNTFCELEDIYGDTSKAFDDLGKGRFKAIRALLYAALKSQDDSLTLLQVGELLDMENLPKVAEAINKALGVSMPEKRDDLVLGK